jgi:UDP-N-acetylmuramoyl-L-alanyl-D-glutamate--2,6-diaminopimelate ligase
MRLSQIVKRDLDVDPEITGVTSDSRKAAPGVLFAALPGTHADGRSFIDQAVAAGAAAILAPLGARAGTVPMVEVQDVRRAYALAARAFWGAEPEICVAVTGTNGKTSIAAFCLQIFTRLGRKAASMGTLGVITSDEVVAGPGMTTPDAGDVARLAAELTGRGVTRLALEASSHGLDQRRLDGLTIRAAGFTNLTQDHLDYHHGMAAYRAAKLRLFDTLMPRGGVAVLNADAADFQAFAAAAVMAGQTVMSVGERGAGLRLNHREATPAGQRLKLRHERRDYEVELPLAGGFQASNVLVAAGLCIAAGEAPERVFEALRHLKGAPGRLQKIGSGPNGGEAYVDYAHTPDGLRTVLQALRPHVRGRLIVVFGAGGDRDRQKRPLMGEAAETLADLAIVTDDNPRSEEPASIRKAILAAAPPLEVPDRRAAIRAAAEQLREGDVLVVAGKGHEQGQIVGGVTHPFDDVAETAAALGLSHG